MTKSILLFQILFCLISLNSEAQWRRFWDEAYEAYDVGEYDIAIKKAIKGRNKCAKEIGKHSYEYTATCNQLGQIFQAKGARHSSEVYYREAETYYSEASQVELTYRGRSKIYGNYQINLGGLYHDLGQYETAIQCYNQALEAYVNIGNVPLFNFVQLGLQFGQTCREMGDLVASNACFYKVLHDIKRSDGEENHDFALISLELAQNLHELGDLQGAEKFSKRATFIFKNLYGPESKWAGEGLLLIGSVTNSMGQYEEAIRHYTEALAILKSTYNENSTRIISARNGLAIAFSNSKKYDKALELYLINEQIIREQFPKQSWWALNSLNSLGRYYFETKDYQKASSYYSKALAESNQSENNTDLLTKIKMNLAQTELKLGDFRRAWSLSKEVLDYNMGRYSDPIQVLSERQKFMTLIQLSKPIKTMHHALLELKDHAKAREFLSYISTINGCVFRDQRNFMKQAHERTDAEYRKVFDSWVGLKKELHRLQLSQNSVPVGIMEELQWRLDADEQTLQLGSTHKKIDLVPKDLWVQCQSRLQSNEVLVYFHNEQVSEDSEESSYSQRTQYSAFVISGNADTIAYIPLFRESELESMIQFEKHAPLQEEVASARTIKRTGPNPKLSSMEMHALIWKPLLLSLQNIKKVHLIPSGILHNISFDILANETQTPIFDQFEIRRFLSMESFLEKRENIQPRTIAAFGGVSYDASCHSESTSNPKRMLTVESEWSERAITDSFFSEMTWNHLPASEKEVESIVQPKVDCEILIYSGCDADETSFWALQSSRPDVIHAATHGFYFEGEVGDKLRSLNAEAGIVLAGANGDAPVFDSSADGILTASEIALMDLSSTNLVVLSACKSGLGDVVFSEGNLGLIRAFKTAGVSHMILSLWDLVDEEAELFMRNFYGIWLESGNLEESFRQTKRALRQRYPDNPRLWAGFILTS